MVSAYVYCIGREEGKHPLLWQEYKMVGFRNRYTNKYFVVLALSYYKTMGKIALLTLVVKKKFEISLLFWYNARTMGKQSRAKRARREEREIRRAQDAQLAGPIAKMEVLATFGHIQGFTVVDAPGGSRQIVYAKKRVKGNNGTAHQETIPPQKQEHAHEEVAVAPSREEIKTEEPVVKSTIKDWDWRELNSTLPALNTRGQELMGTLVLDAAANRETADRIKQEILKSPEITADHIFVAALKGAEKGRETRSGHKERG